MEYWERENAGIIVRKKFREAGTFTRLQHLVILRTGVNYRRLTLPIRGVPVDEVPISFRELHAWTHLPTIACFGEWRILKGPICGCL